MLCFSIPGIPRLLCRFGLRGPHQHLTSTLVFVVCVKTPNVSQSLLPQSLLRERNLEKLKFEATLSCSDRLKSQRLILELVVGSHSNHMEVADSSEFDDVFWRNLNGNAPGTGS